MKILFLLITAVFLGSCNTPSTDASGQTDSMNAPAAAPDNSSTGGSTQPNDPHDTSTWEGATNDTAR